MLSVFNPTWETARVNPDQPPHIPAPSQASHHTLPVALLALPYPGGTTRTRYQSGDPLQNLSLQPLYKRSELTDLSPPHLVSIISLLLSRISTYVARHLSTDEDVYVQLDDSSITIAGPKAPVQLGGPTQVPMTS